MCKQYEKHRLKSRVCSKKAKMVPLSVPKNGSKCKSKQFGVCLNRMIHRFNRLGHCTTKLSARSILVSAAVKELRSHFITGKIVHGTQGNSYFSPFGVLAQGYRESHSLYNQRHIDKSLGVSALEIETSHFFARKRVVARTKFGIEVQFVVKNITGKPYAALGIVVENVAIDFVFVKPFGEQFAYYEINFRT